MKRVYITRNEYYPKTLKEPQHSIIKNVYDMVEETVLLASDAAKTKIWICFRTSVNDFFESWKEWAPITVEEK